VEVIRLAKKLEGVFGREAALPAVEFLPAEIRKRGSGGKAYPPNLIVSRNRIASRWFAITCDCQMMATDISPIRKTQTASARFV
jgi:hypothetical protein